MFRSLIAFVVAACLLQAVSIAARADQTQPPLPANPNIVVFLVDDVSPHDGRLWNDPARTPNIYQNFIAHGINLPNAIGENPLCCPGRSNILTGQHSHNNRVIQNRARQFDPAEHIGKAMMEAGYASYYVGKYLNNNQQLGNALWAQHDAGWTQLDVIKGVNGDYLDYWLHTKQGNQYVGGVHSTQMIADRAVTHLRSTPANQPVFAVLSMYNLHGPNTPMAQDRGDPRCASIPPWVPGNYNEADVSDKPAAIRALPLQPHAEGWPMVRYCEEMLGVDRAVGQVVNELRAQGRLDNTLLVFTADNGIAWGAHRLGQQKVWPYTTPVPLYMYWPAAGWGTTPRVEPEIVSNIDLAPTFCQLATNCTLGPFNRGSAAPDGFSMVPLLAGVASSLGRDAVLEESYSDVAPPWSGLRTTSLFDSANRWHYVEYVSGERELYELVSDPWELNNLAADPAYAGLVGTLSQRLAQLRVEGITAGTGAIRIVQDSKPNSAADFNFSGDLGNFALDDDSDPTLPREVTFTGLPSGEYNLVRSPPPGWRATLMECSSGVGVFDLGSGNFNIYLHPDEYIDCTITDKPGAAGQAARVDAMIAKWQTGPFKKNDYYRSTPTRKQTVRRRAVAAGASYDYWLRLQNDSGAAETLTVRGQFTGPSGAQVTYLDNGVDVSAQVAAGTYAFGGVPAGGTVELLVRVSIAPGTPRRSVAKVLVYGSSASQPSLVDVVKAVTKTQ